ncbi:MAG: hypothetical protein AB1700_09940, partial [Bacillota bacterium]
ACNDYGDKRYHRERSLPGATKVTPFLLAVFELSAFSNGLFLHGLRRRFPELPDEEIKRLYLERIAKCYNRNY